MNFYWSDEYLIGIQQIDNQHKKIIKQVNKVYKLIDLEMSINEIVPAFEFLIDTIEIHFNTENRLMKGMNSQDFKLHINEHGIYLKNLNVICKTLAKSVNRKKLQNIIDWQISSFYEEHIIKFDKILGESISINNKASV
ncbi:MAG: hemerythrin family protein [bacterium]|nr:hemerythrin family protein [bacterium]